MIAVQRRTRKGYLAVLLLLTACNGDDGVVADGGRADAMADAARSDSARDSLPHDSSSADGAPACAPTYQGDDAWSYALTVKANAHFCVLGAGTTLWERLQHKAELNFVPGHYKLPDAEGEFALTLPLCLTRPGERSRVTEAGELGVTFDEIFSDTTVKALVYRQPLTLGSDSWTLESRWEVYHRSGQPNPELILDDQLRHGTYPDSESSYTLCSDNDCDNRWEIFPCGANETARSTAVTFNRGSATFHASLVEGLIGAGGTVAGLWHAQGTLDGTPFDQTDYYRLAHQPDHHNQHGGFVVLFDQPIGSACGLEVHVPSTDGSFIYDQLEGWTIDCNGNQLEALDGLTL